MSEKTTGKTVYFTPDPNNPVRLTEEQRARLDAMTDKDIDLSDIPSQAGKPGWHPGRYSPEVSAEVRRAALREGFLLVDKDVVEFFKQDGGRPLERMRAVLREYVESHRKSA
jgi:uncharacterized protein (DUF4415 family)